MHGGGGEGGDRGEFLAVVIHGPGPEFTAVLNA